MLFTWQGYGLVVALLCAGLTRYASEHLSSGIRRNGYTPLVTDVLLIILMIVSVLALRFFGGG